MDPDILLVEMRELARDVIAQADEPEDSDESSPDDYDKLVNNAADLAEKFEALDKWIMSGGFLPKEWKEKLLGKLFEAYKNDRGIKTSCHATMWELEKAHRELFGIKDIDNIEDVEMK